MKKMYIVKIRLLRRFGKKSEREREDSMWENASRKREKKLSTEHIPARQFLRRKILSLQCPVSFIALV